MRNLAGLRRVSADAFCLFGLLIPLLYLFRGVLFADDSLLYRDVAHFYEPAWAYAQSRLSAGELPLWNPLEGLGHPLLGDPTSSILYPGKLLLLLPVEISRGIGLYVVLHLWLGGSGVYAIARYWRRSPVSGIVSGLAYELSGQVLFQYCNPIYAVGAAWLPWAVLSLLAMFRGDWQSRLFSAGMHSVCLAMLVLGGDPQSAVHVCLAALLWIALRGSARARRHRNRVRQKSRLDPTHPDSADALEHRAAAALPAKRFSCRVVFPPVEIRAVACWTGSIVLALLLSAMQIVPTWSLARHSSRVDLDQPTDVWSWLASSVRPLLVRKRVGNRPSGRIALQETVDATKTPIRGPSVSGMWLRSDSPHACRVYQFSVGPWRWPELIWPNIFGNRFPQHTRWIDALPAEGRVWTPSLYLGLLPLLLAGYSMAWRRRSARVRWLTWLVLLSMLAAAGRFGLGWLIDEWHFATQSQGFPNQEQGGEAFQPSRLESGLGGVYWWLKTFVPGYSGFRYPAKWWTVTTLSLSLLAAKSTDVIWKLRPRHAERLRKLEIVARCLVIVSLLLGLSLLAGTFLSPAQRLGDWLASGVPPRPMFGPFQPTLACRNVLFSLLQTLCIGLLLVGLLNVSRRCCTGFLESGFPESGFHKPGFHKPGDQKPGVHEPCRVYPQLHRTRLIARSIAAGCVLLTVADLLIAQHRLIVSGASHLQFPVEIESHEQSEPVRSPVPTNQPRTGEPPMQMFPRLYRPPIEQSQRANILEFRSTTSPERMQQIHDWESATLRPRYHLLANIRGLNTVFAIDRADYAALLAVAEQKSADGEAAESLPPSLLDLLGADYVGKFDSGDAFRLAGRPTALPRAWTVSHWEWLDDPPPKNFAQHRQRAEAVLFGRDGNVRDFRRTAVLERQDSGSFKPEQSILQSVPSAITPAERSELDARATALEASEITWLRDLPERILLRVRCPHRRLLVLADQYDTDWQVHVSTSAGPSSRYRLWRANRVMRGVLLPAGDHLVEFRYRPRAVLVGAGLSLVGWLSVVGCLLVLWPRRRRLTNRLCGVDADLANL